MKDVLLELSERPRARRAIKSSGLPVPLPQRLRRGEGPWTERPLQGLDVVVRPADGAELNATLAQTLAPAGANPWVVGDERDAAPYAEPGEAWGRPATLLSSGEVSEDVVPHGLVLDASGVHEPEELRALYDVFHDWLPRVASNGRVLVLGRPPEARDTAAGGAAAQALEGFVRSISKEIGKRGATAQLVRVDPGAEDRVPPVLRFLLSARSAFVTGQPFHVRATAKAVEEPRWLRPLEGKVALVTGAGRGIGEATARRLAEEGAHVLVVDRPEDDGPASRVAREIGGTPVLLDVSDPEAPKQLARQVREEHGGVDVVVHNAGVTPDKTLAKMKPEQWDQALGVNLIPPVRITETLRSEGLLRRGGRVLCLSSIAGIAGNFGQTNYATSKAGLIGFVRHLAPTMASEGVTVNAVAPGFIETRLTAAMPTATREVARRTSSLSQGGTPLDVAEMLTFLATPGASGLTGSLIRVCGGNWIGA